MDLIDQIIEQAKNMLVCPVCKGHYEAGEIKFRGFIDNTYIFQTYCAKKHSPVAVTYLASLHRMEKPISAYFHTLSGEKISEKTVEEASKTFEGFDGDFGKAWK